jgi:hypothetical protein
MITFEQYILQENEQVTRHVATKQSEYGKRFLEVGDIYYTNRKGQFHRDNGPAIIRKDGMKIWYQNDEISREGGPAITYLDGSQEWRINGSFHRLDGPAIIWKNGDKKWYIHGTEILNPTDEEKWMFLKANIGLNLDFLNRAGMTEDMQEYVCINRPDLIGEIEDLDPILKEKYKDEMNLSNVEV